MGKIAFRRKVSLDDFIHLLEWQEKQDVTAEDLRWLRSFCARYSGLTEEEVGSMPPEDIFAAVQEAVRRKEAAAEAAVPPQTSNASASGPMA
jgi:hypothetical protein